MPLTEETHGNNKPAILELYSLIGANTLANADQAISKEGFRLIVGGGSTSADGLRIENPNGDVNVDFRMNQTTFIQGYVGINNSNLGPGYGGHRLTVASSGSSKAVLIYTSGANSKGLEVSMTGSGGSMANGVNIVSTNLVPEGKRGLSINVDGSTSENTALIVTKGNVVFQDLPTSSVGLAGGTLWNHGGHIKVA